MKLKKSDPAYTRAARLDRRRLPARRRQRPPQCVKIEVYPPTGRVLKRPAHTQQLCVLAHFSDGSVRDVTELACYSSSDGQWPMSTPAAWSSATTGAKRRSGSLPGARRIVLPDVREGHSGLRVEQPAGAQLHRRARLRQAAAAQVSARRTVQRRRVPPPRLSRRDRPAADASKRRKPSWPMHARQAGQADRHAARAARVRQVLGPQVGRPAADDDDADRQRRGLQVSPLAASVRSRQHALRPVRPRAALGRAAARSTTRRPTSTARRPTPTTASRRPRRSSSAPACNAPSATIIRSSAGRRTTTTAWRRSSTACSGRNRRAADEMVIFMAGAGEVTQPRTGKQMKPWLPGQGEIDLPADADRREPFVDWLRRRRTTVLRQGRSQPHLEPPAGPRHRRSARRLPRFESALQRRAARRPGQGFRRARLRPQARAARRS